MILSSLLRGSASGPGTASNGGSVPLTPINDDAVHSFDYHLSTRMNGLDMGATPPSSMGGMVGSGMHPSMVGGMGAVNEMHMGGMHPTSGLVHDDMDGIEEDEDEDEDDMQYGSSANPNVLTMASRSRSSSALNMALSNGSTASLVGGGGSPRRSNVSGVERTQKKRRSATIAAGPSAAVAGVSRSRSGTLIGGNLPPTIMGANGLPMPTSMMGMGGVMNNPALAFSPIEGIPPSVSNGMVGPPSTQLTPSIPMSGPTTNGVNGVTVPAGLGVGGQANSPLAMKELSASMKAVIEGYLLRYLNYLCMNRECLHYVLSRLVFLPPFFLSSNSASSSSRSFPTIQRASTPFWGPFRPPLFALSSNLEYGFHHDHPVDDPFLLVIGDSRHLPVDNPYRLPLHSWLRRKKEKARDFHAISLESQCASHTTPTTATWSHRRLPHTHASRIRTERAS
jgi:hypothetical protein